MFAINQIPIMSLKIQGGREMRFQRFPVVVLVLTLAVCLSTAAAFGQSLTTGNITGTVSDPSNAVVPGAKVNLKGTDTGYTASTTTNSSGSYNFGLLKPGNYQVSVKQSGFAETVQSLVVELGQTTTANLQLAVSKTSETIEVSAAAPLINTEPSINTSFTQQEVAQLPSAGGDITNIADTAPGVVVNGTSGYGNFTLNGLPATSNLFTVNGENDMDPYFNINNSGATNLTLGQNEVSEATVVANAYGGQYGQLAGAQVTYATKSGTNAFHGNALYWWNGRLLNANNWMNKQSQQAAHAIDPTQPANQPAFSNANQWAASFGGPIIKDKTFFFVDYEGMRFVLPNVDQVTTPTPEFATAVAAGVAANDPNQTSAFSTLLGLWQNAPGYSTASPYAPSCFDASGNPLDCALVPSTAGAFGDSCYTFGQNGGFGSATWDTASPTPCSAAYTATPTALAWEYILSFRVDHKLTNNDNLFVRYKLDHGLQPTLLDPIDSRFDANSLQPSWDTQVSETHVFGPTKTNQFTASLSHYVAQFTAPQAAGVFNYAQIFNEDSGIYNFTSPNRAAYAFPQGRNITQYQFFDDFSWTRGNHTFKFGENFRRYDVSDHNFFFNSPAVYWGYSTDALQSFADGLAYQYRKNDNIAQNVPVALWGIGVYGQDEWKARRNLKLTLALRVERNSNPVCQINCFANLNGPFANTPSAQAGALQDGSELDVPYSSDINYNRHQAYPDVDKLVFSPRLGFSWDPRGNGKTVVSGGYGLFYDNPAAGLVDNLLGNPPDAVAIRVRNSPSSAGVLPFDPNGAPATWQASASAFTITDSFNQIKAALPTGVRFNPPSVGAIVGTIKAPEWSEWNLSVQQELSRSLVVLVNYVGNHGARITYFNSWPNAWDGTGGYFNGTVPISFTNPAGPALANNYSTVTEFRSGAISNYNGLTVSLRKQFSHWIAAHLNYTWSHNMDETSNGGLFNYGFEGNNSILGQLYPTSLRTANYGNSDYDIRHLLNGDFVVNPTFHKTGALRWVTEGWQFSGKLFWRTGLPESIVDGNLNGFVVNGGDTTLATVIGNAQPKSCGASNASFSGSAPGCLDAAGLFDTGTGVTDWFNGVGGPLPTGYSTQRRNQYRGPHYFDMDLNLFKNFKVERFNFAIGAQAFNAFNHPNFALPNSTFFTGDPTFGTISSMQGTPTSPYGNFLGFDSSPRVMQVSFKMSF
jgi:Carboxypeptidase regulatory-like domain